MKSTTILATLSALSVASTAAVECPNSIDLDAWTEKELSGLSLKYAVVLAPSPEESLFCARLECDSENWVAFGISPSGTMDGGEGIIGLPDDGSVQKYDLGTSTRVQLMSDDKQTLMYTSVTQEGGQTIMEFAKYLSEPGEHEIDPNGKNTFLYAFGSSNQLGYHSSNRSPFTVMLDASESSTPAPSPGGDGDGNEDVGNSSLKTLSPTPGAPARDPNPNPIPDDTTDDDYNPAPIEPYPAPTPTGSGAIVGKIVSTMVLGVAAVWFGI